MNWYWYYIFGAVISNVTQYFLKVMFKALLVAHIAITFGMFVFPSIFSGGLHR